MEMSLTGRVATFAAIVIVLAGLGAWIFLTPATGATRPAGPTRTAAAGPTPTAVPSSAVPSPTAPSATASPAPQGGSVTGQHVPDIYQWLPFTSADLAAASRVTTDFGALYGSYSYRLSTAQYLATMKGLVTSQLSALIGRAYSAPGVAGVRLASKQTATATAVITALRSFGPSSMTFLVRITQRTTDRSGHSTLTTMYAVTVTGGRGWLVSDIELASSGNS